MAEDKFHAVATDPAGIHKILADHITKAPPEYVANRLANLLVMWIMIDGGGLKSGVNPGKLIRETFAQTLTDFGVLESKLSVPPQDDPRGN